MNHPVSTPRNLSSRPSTPRTPRHSLFGKQTLAPIPSIVLPARPRPNRAPAPEGHLPSTWRQRRNEPNQFGGELPPNSSQCRYRRRALVHSISEQQTFLSVDDETGEDVFLREIRKYKGEGVASESARRLANEVNTLRTLQGCPSVLEFKDQFQTAEKLVVVTEACHGGTLQHVLEVGLTSLLERKRNIIAAPHQNTPNQCTYAF
ncbi:hypothetical protein BSKO_01772 [Bryopsis sp. KO-2023]|nr:hypothetical protein BSKO_01772 [Bryopsis sp. KO-2023]